MGSQRPALVDGESVADFINTRRTYREFSEKTNPTNEDCPFCREPFEAADIVQGIVVETSRRVEDNGHKDIRTIIVAAHPLCCRAIPSADGVH